MIAASVVFHVGGLVFLSGLLQATARRVQSSRPRWRMTVILTVAVFVIIGIHTIEAWSWAFLYMLIGEFSDLSQALYFSIVTSTTLGYGDITLTDQWRLLSTFEAMGGLILFGASTAFLLATMRHLFQQQPAD